MTDKKEDVKKDDSRKEPGSLPSVPKEEKELGMQSCTAFTKKDFKKCVGFLKKLSNKRCEDPKVWSNYGLAEFFHSGCRNVDRYMHHYGTIEKILDVEMNSINKIDDIDHCIIYFNQAVIFYHLHRYQAAIRILDKIFISSEPFDFDLARQVCFLLIELYLCTNQPERALGLVNYVDKTLFRTNEGDAKLKEKQQIGKEDAELSLHRPKLLQFKVRSYIMLKSMKACRRESKSLMAYGTSVQATYLKSNTEYLRCNFKKAIRLLNSHPATTPVNFEEVGENVLVYYNNNLGCMNVYGGKPNLSLHYFNKAFQEMNSQYKKLLKSCGSMQSLPLIVRNGNLQYHLYYNMGLALLFSNKPNAAFKYLTKAVKQFPKNPRLWLRIAECCIAAQKQSNEEDFKISGQKADVLDTIVGSGQHRKLNITTRSSNNQTTCQNGYKSMAQGPNLPYARYCLNNACMILGQCNTNTVIDLSLASKSDSAQILQNADAEKASQNNSQSSSGDASYQYISALPANPISGAEITSLRISVLTAKCYVNLCLNNPYEALTNALSILEIPKLLPRYKYLAHMYAGEALVKLNKIKEAVQHFDYGKLGSDFNIAPVEPEKPRDDAPSNANQPKEAEKLTNHFVEWFPATNGTAKNAMQYNLAVCHVLKRDSEKAAKEMKKMTSNQGQNIVVPLQTITLAMYIQLQLGRFDLCKGIIKQNSLQYG